MSSDLNQLFFSLAWLHFGEKLCVQISFSNMKKQNSLRIIRDQNIKKPYKWFNDKKW